MAADLKERDVLIKKINNDKSKEDILAPAYAGRIMAEPIPKNRLPDESMEPRTAYNLIHDELMMDGSSRLNLATFVTTWMEPEAKQLMASCFDKNMIDKDEYPQTAEIEQRCINMILDLFNAPGGQGLGVSTIGSSEAVMLSGLALKWKWRERMNAGGKPTDRPNIVMGTNVQVVWEKFCRYWDVEPRYIPMEHGRYVITPEEVVKAVDENTIAVMAILGTTYSGQFEPIEDIHEALMKLNAETGWETPMHVDAASGGFVAPFIYPDLKWDFQLPLIKSINVSGHKYGLVYPGVGWAVWRDRSEVPEDLVFHVDYLGGDMPTFTLNFSRPGNQIVGQYYNFLRLGKAGYARIMETLHDTANYLSAQINLMGPFELLSDGSELPVFAFRLKTEKEYSVYDLSAKLREFGWQVPAYTMPANADDVAVLRVVVREGFSRDMADMFLDDIRKTVDFLKNSPNYGGKKYGLHFRH